MPHERSASSSLSQNTPIWRQSSGRHGNHGLIELSPAERAAPDKRRPLEGFPPFFPLREQPVEIFDCAEKAIVKRCARLPPQGASTRNVWPTLLWIILRQRTMNDPRVGSSEFDYFLG